MTQVTSLRGDQAPPVNVPGIDKPVIVVTGSVSGTESWTNNFYYVLRGAVFVPAGATLNIQAGTRVIGESGSVGTLIMLRGGRLNAIGTREQPIVFTSDQAIGDRNRGDWGGVIINGRAPVNIEGGQGLGEADTGVYGGDNPNDDSGIMRYVRVEFAGVEFSPDNELNGIAFQAVGRGSTYEYIQVHMNRDDALEWLAAPRISSMRWPPTPRMTALIGPSAGPAGHSSSPSISAATTRTGVSKLTTTSSTTTCCRGLIHKSTT